MATKKTDKVQDNKVSLSEKEKLKLINYILTMNDTCVVVNTGEKDAEKKFLGYEFSNRRGNEGLHEYDEGSSLYDMSDPLNEDKDKVNYLIKECFLGRKVSIPNSLENNIRVVSSDEIVDFSSGNKFIVNPKIKFLSKYDKVLLNDLIVKLESGSRPKGGKTSLTDGVMSIGGENIGADNSLILSNVSYVSNDFYNKSLQGKIFNGDILINKDGACTGKLTQWKLDKTAMSNEHCFILNVGEYQDYIFYLLQHSTYNKMLNQISQKSTTPGLNRGDLCSIGIPLPEKDIRDLIMKECSEVDKNVEVAKGVIRSFSRKIEMLYGDIVCSSVKLSDKSLFSITAGGDAPNRKEIRSQKDNEYNIPIYSNGTGKSALYGYTKDNSKVIKKDAITIAARGSIGYSELRKAPYLPIVRLISVIPNGNNINLEYLKFAIKMSEKDIVSNANGSSIQQLTIPMAGNIEILLPTIDKQIEIAKEYKVYEEEINKAKAIIENARFEKDKIIDKYLK